MESTLINIIFDTCQFVDSVEKKKLSENGFLSSLYQATLHFRRPDISDTLVVKLPDGSKIRDALFKVIERAPTEEEVAPHLHALYFFFLRELDFYEMKPSPPGLQLPHVYRCVRDEPKKYALVMEDLSAMRIVPYFQTLSIGQVVEIGKQLLQLHTFSLTMSSEWTRKFPYPDQLLDSVSSFGGFVETFVDRNPVLGLQYRKIKKIFSDRQFLGRILRDSHKELNVQDVICHGDLWSYNIMWQPTANGEPSETLGKIIDWQNVHTGSIGEDYAHLMAFNCDTEIRRTIERVHLPKHYSQLRLRAFCSYVKFEMTLEQFMRSYRRNFVAHALHATFILSTMLRMKPEDNVERTEQHLQIILKRIIGNWEDAIAILKEEFPEYPLE